MAIRTIIWFIFWYLLLIQAVLGEVAKVFGVRLGHKSACHSISKFILVWKPHWVSIQASGQGVWGVPLCLFCMFRTQMLVRTVFLVWCRSKRQLARGVKVGQNFWRNHVRPRFSEVSVKRFDTHQTSGCFSMKHMDALEIRLQELCF